MDNFDVAAEYSEKFIRLFEHKRDPASKKVALSRFLNRLDPNLQSK